MKETLPQLSGVYAITHTETGRRYVGSSVNIRARVTAHKWALRKGRHHSPHLQSVWAKYGEASFQITVLEICSKDTLVEREQFHIDAAPSLNARPVADRKVGMPHSAETKAKISIARSGPKFAKQKEALSLKWKNDPEFVEAITSARKRQLSDPLVLASTLAAMNSDDAVAKRLSVQNSPEYRAKMSAAKLGRKRTPEQRAAISRGRTGVRLSDEAKAIRRAKMASKTIGGI